MSYKSKAEYNSEATGRQRFYDRATSETIIFEYPVAFYDDFVGADVVIPATGSDESGTKWTKKIVGAAPPTVVKTANGVNGLVALSFTSANQKQDAVLHMDDQLMFSIAQGCIFETRLTLTVAPTLNTIASWGLWGAWADGGSNFRVGFEVTSTSLIAQCESDDNATDSSKATGTTLVVGTYNIFRIDCTNQSDIKFWIDGSPVAGAAGAFTFVNAASAGNSKSQPHIGLYKSTGAGLGVISVDYVKIWQERS